jgi:hypothetical protein
MPHVSEGPGPSRRPGPRVQCGACAATALRPGPMLRITRAICLWVIRSPETRWARPCGTGPYCGAVQCKAGIIAGRTRVVMIRIAWRRRPGALWAPGGLCRA